MIKRSYLVLVLAAMLGVGTAAAYGNSQDRKEKEKQKDRAAASEAVVADVFPLAIQIGGGSYLGVYLEDLTSERAQSLKLKEARGALVMRVAEGSPAEKAGLKENDVITSFNGRPVESVRELQRLLSETPEGRTVEIEAIRDGNRQRLSATLTGRSNEFRGFGRAEMDRIRRETELAQKELKENMDRMRREQLDLGTFDFTVPRMMELYRGSRLGVSVESLGDQLAEYFGVRDGKGVLVTEVRADTPAAKAGLKAGDVITAIDGQKIEGVNALLRALNQKEEGQLTLTIVRNRSEQTLTVTLEKRQTRLTIPRRAFVTA